VAPAPAAEKGPGIASRAAGFFSGLGGLEGRRRTQAIVAAAAGLAIVIVLIVVATSGGSSGGSDCKPVDTSAAQQAGAPLIKLTAMGEAANADCSPSGQVTLGRAQQNQNASTKNQPPVFILQTNAVHLQPTGSGNRYVLWLYKSDTQAVPLGQETVDSSGNLTGGVPLLPQQVLLLPAFDTVRFSKMSTAQAQQLQQALQAQSKKGATGTVQFTGTPVLQGNISELGLGQLLQQAQSQAQAQGQAGAGATGSGSPGTGASGGAGNKKG
jgi:hypothetical protein